jgi:hypothetical protein
MFIQYVYWAFKLSDAGNWVTKEFAEEFQIALKSDWMLSGREYYVKSHLINQEADNKAADKIKTMWIEIIAANVSLILYYLYYSYNIHSNARRHEGIHTKWSNFKLKDCCKDYPTSKILLFFIDKDMITTIRSNISYFKQVSLELRSSSRIAPTLQKRSLQWCNWRVLFQRHCITCIYAKQFYTILRN